MTSTLSPAKQGHAESLALWQPLPPLPSPTPSLPWPPSPPSLLVAPLRERPARHRRPCRTSGTRQARRATARAGAVGMLPVSRPATRWLCAHLWMCVWKKRTSPSSGGMGGRGCSSDSTCRKPERSIQVITGRNLYTGASRAAKSRDNRFQLPTAKSRDGERGRTGPPFGIGRGTDDSPPSAVPGRGSAYAAGVGRPMGIQLGSRPCTCAPRSVNAHVPRRQRSGRLRREATGQAPGGGAAWR